MIPWTATPDLSLEEPVGEASEDPVLDWRRVFATLRRKELYGNFAVHLFVLIPITVLFGRFGMDLDRTWGWAPILTPPWNIVAALPFFAAGGLVVCYTYGYLHLMGHGSPGSHMGWTTQMVTSGIYSWVRHPSVIGKFFGVVGLGLILRSPGFLFVILPILCLYSYITNRLIQERFCLSHFGDEYRRYRDEVPMVIPRWSRIRRALRERGR